MTRKVTLSDGKQIPAIGWGNGSGGLLGSGQKAVDLGAVALEAGILHLDTAQVYLTEKETMESVKKVGVERSKVWITTKISDNSVAADATTEANVRQSVKESLERLGTKPDLFLIHNPQVPEEGKIGEFWTYFENLVLDGTLEGVSLGVSNFRPQDIEAVLKVARIKPVVNQLEFHPYVLAQLEPFIASQAAHGIKIESYGPLTPLLRHPTGGPVKVEVERIANERGIEPSAVLLLWTIQKGAVAVTTSGNPVNIRKIASVDGMQDLSEDDVRKIDEAGKKIHFRYYEQHMTKDYAPPNLPKDI